MNSYCESCFFLFRILQTCPRSYIFNQGDTTEKITEILWVFGSLQPYVIGLGLVLYTFFKRSSRSFLILSNALITTFVCEVILKRILAEARPAGACSLSYGLPSGHSAFAAALLTWFSLEYIFLNKDAMFKMSGHYSILRNIAFILIPFNPISRYYLNYHHVKQIGYGLLTGFIITWIFFTVIIITHKQNNRFWSNLFYKLKLKDNFICSKGMNIDGSAKPVSSGTELQAVYSVRDTSNDSLEVSIRQ